MYLTNHDLIAELRNDRTDTADGRGGGLLVYVKKGLQILPVDNNSNFNQYVCFNVLNSNVTTHVILVYRPPNSSSTNTDKLCDIVKNAPKNSLIIGDINFPAIDWNNLTCDSSNGRNFMNACIDNNFSQYVNFSTCTRPPYNVLDLVLSNNDSILNVENLGPLSNSDHVMLLIDTDYETNYDIDDAIKKDWKNADFESLNSKLENVNWNNVLSSDNMNEKWKSFVEKLRDIVDENVPNKRVKSESKLAWKNQFITKLQRKKSRLYKRWKQTGSESDFQNYKEVEKEVKKVIKKAKRRLEVKVSKESGNEGKRKFNQYVKSKLSKNNGVGPLLDKDKNLVADPQGMANILNDFFSSVFTNDDNTNPVPVRQDFETVISDFEVTFKDIEIAIDATKAGKAPGPDNITSTVLKKCKKNLLLPLKIIFESSLSSAQIPDDWKNARVVPIPKKGSRAVAGNYRPVSLTSTVCKLLERIMRSKLMDHLIENKIINLSQHGFMSDRSCQTNLLEFLDKITKMLDEGKAADVIYLDYSKAFDKICHSKLITKLEAHGIKGNIQRWICEWLRDRQQWVEIKGHKSSSKGVTSGVPQGSCLGPLLFIIYINDIDIEANNIDILRKFADDTKGAKEIDGPEDAAQLQECINNLEEWSRKWSMEFNVKKCKIMHCGRNNPKHSYNIGGETLKVVESEKDIGVTISSNLKPSQQCQEAAGRARCELGKISKCFHFRDKKVFLRLYMQFVRSHLEFSSSVWCPWNQTDIDMLENVQKQAVRMVSGLQATSYEERLKEIGLWTLEKRRQMFDMVQVYKVLNNIGNVEISLSKIGENISSRINTRSQSDSLNLVKNRSSLDIRKHFFTERVVDQWNRLPSEVKHAPTLRIFKNAIKKCLD